jgi:hypothetical protein
MEVKWMVVLCRVENVTRRTLTGGNEATRVLVLFESDETLTLCILFSWTPTKSESERRRKLFCGELAGGSRKIPYTV